jgi:hypothetical protein
MKEKLKNGGNLSELFKSVDSQNGIGSYQGI